MNAQPVIETMDDAASMVLQAQEHLDMARYTPAMELAVRAETLAGTPAVRAHALAVISACHHRLDRYAQSIEVGLQAVRLWHELGDLAGESSARSTIARVLILTGDLTESLDEGLIALELADLSGELRPRLLALTAIGIVHLCLRQHELSIEYCERAAETARLLGDVAVHGSLIDTISCVFMGQAYAAREEGNEEAALSYGRLAADRAREAMEIGRQCGHRYYQVNALGNLAEGLAFIGRPAEALELMDTIQIDPELDSVSMVTHLLDTRGCVHLALKNYDQAARLFAEALELSAGNNTAMYYCEHLSEAHEKNGDFRAALEYHKRFHTLFTLVASEAAQRSASIAAIRLETSRAQDYAMRERARAEELYHSNLELTRHAESLLQQSLEDPLTGLANRRLLDRLLETEGQRYSIALLDVDHFKRVNDSYSHQIGDQVLRQLGALLLQSSRPADHAARYGGEEFALLLSDQGDEPDEAVAERLRELIEAFDWTPIAPGLRVTVSIGIAAHHEAGSATALLEIADRRLYEAKNGGRNRVVGPESPSPSTAPGFTASN
ncbi:GGDEF domain-containing protein [Actinoplanes awajinensis]|uniref:GGDEF domain-containing protein n=1 Tax=Actinoplanes awajinensis TaxID=135946 RepID=UPI0012F8D00C|nr:GGDEF domain-containing protein [Actinoplanes awajinensis]